MSAHLRESMRACSVSNARNCSVLAQRWLRTQPPTHAARGAPCSHLGCMQCACGHPARRRARRGHSARWSRPTLYRARQRRARRRGRPCPVAAAAGRARRRRLAARLRPTRGASASRLPSPAPAHFPRRAREKAARRARRARDARGARRRRARARAAAATPAGAPPRAGGRRSLRLRSSARVRAAGTQVPARCARCGTRGGQYFFACDLFCALTCLHRGHAWRGAPYQRRRATVRSDIRHTHPHFSLSDDTRRSTNTTTSTLARRGSPGARTGRRVVRTSPHRSLCSSCPRPRLLRASVVARSLCVGSVGEQPFVCNTRRLFRGGSPPSCLDAARRVQPCVRCTDALGRQRFISSQPASSAGRRRRCCSRRMPRRICRRPLGVC